MVDDDDTTTGKVTIFSARHYKKYDWDGKSFQHPCKQSKINQ